MKILLYTISDFKDRSIDCIDLLLSSIIFDINTDFCIITNKKNINCKYKTITDESITENDYVGSLKYSSTIPKNYDYIIYLDSDILYFDKISRLIDMSKVFTVVNEDCLINNHPWFYFDDIDINDKIIYQKCKALNAGSFAIHSSRFKILSEIQVLYQQNKHKKQKLMDLAKLEQSIYNYVLYKNNNFENSNFYDITNFVEIHASSKNKVFNKTLYHFCGFSNTMTSKYHNMKAFYQKYIK